MPAATSTITINIVDPASRDRRLEQVASELRDKAIGCGILVIRVDYATFTLAVGPEVAYGETLEVDLL